MKSTSSKTSMGMDCHHRCRISLVSTIYMILPANQGIRPDLASNIAPRNHAMPPGVSGFHDYPIAYHMGTMSHPPFTGSLQQAIIPYQIEGLPTMVSVLKNLVMKRFVSYESPAAAQNAMHTINGCEIGVKKLRVELKRDKRQNIILSRTFK
ncbi:hypothetical protein GQ457_11G002670 [Hibiscus cannabinus]